MADQGEVLLDTLCAPSGPLPGTVVVAAHPDDEVLGAGSRLPRLSPLLIVHATDGAPADLRDARAAGCSSREEYVALRRSELRAALEAAGIPSERTRQIGLVDQQASYHLADLSRAVAGILLEAAVPAVLTHAYEGGHPDHDAAAFAVDTACRLLTRDGHAAPRIVEFTGYHDRDGQIGTGSFLADADGEASATRIVRLSPEEQALKRRMLSCFGSQRSTVQLFSLEEERFRLAPHRAFTSPPHPGTLLYERFPWGMAGRLWRNLAADALRELGLHGHPGA